MSKSGALGMALATLVWATSPLPHARAQDAPFDRAIAALERGEIEPVLGLLDEALEDPTIGRDRLALVFLYVAFVEDRLGHTSQRDDALVRALALDPSIAPAAMMPSSFRAQLNAARSRMSGGGLALEAVAEGRTLRITVIGAPEGLVGAVELRVEGLTERMSPPGPWTVTVPDDRLPAGRRTVAQVVLFGPHGNTLASVGVDLEAPTSVLAMHVVEARRVEIDLARPEAARAIEAWVGDHDAPRWLTRLTPPGPFVLEVPDSAFVRDVVEVSFLALGADDREVERATLAVPRSRAQEVWENPFFWTVIGALVAGGVVAGVVIGTAETRYQLVPTVEGLAISL